MRTLLCLVGLLALGVGPVAAQEQANVTDPTAKPVTTYRVVRVVMDISSPSGAFFAIDYVDNFGTRHSDEHRGPCQQPQPGQPSPTPKCADELIKTFNIADFTVSSLVRQLLIHLMDEDVIPPATITGTPPPPNPYTPAPFVIKKQTTPPPVGPPPPPYVIKKQD